ncbi:MAG: dihydrofolate reductase [Ilumatobacter sp.]|nr:dihydrofolate reductase [Ilumatobacter sp.]
MFIASSLDGFIAGPDDELDWLDFPDIEDTFTPFFAEVGALLMGRRTYDVASGFDEWGYGDTPVLVATTRPLPDTHPTVRAVTGSIDDMVAEAKRVAGDRDVYLDGGELVRQALDAELVDEMTVTMIPVVLGAGRPLFAGVGNRHELELQHHRDIGSGLVQLVYRPT